MLLVLPAKQSFHIIYLTCGGVGWEGEQHRAIKELQMGSNHSRQWCTQDEILCHTPARPSYVAKTRKGNICSSPFFFLHWKLRAIHTLLLTDNLIFNSKAKGKCVCVCAVVCVDFPSEWNLCVGVMLIKSLPYTELCITYDAEREEIKHTDEKSTYHFLSLVVKS